MNELKLTELFHEIYERRAPEFGYETRKETKKFDPTTPNGRLMIAVCGEIIERLKLKGDTYVGGGGVIFCSTCGAPCGVVEDEDEK
jgi:hypothetical protein